MLELPFFSVARFLVLELDPDGFIDEPRIAAPRMSPLRDAAGPLPNILLTPLPPWKVRFPIEEVNLVLSWVWSAVGTLTYPVDALLDSNSESL